MPVGLYGKYPGKRDFLVANLPRAVLQPLENWMQGGMAASRQQLGRSWSDLYHVQPIWNFRIGASVTGVDCVGAMIPSVDKVGRLFPLAILAHAAPQTSGYAAWSDFLSSDWLESVHQRLLLALSDEAPAEQVSLIDGLAEPAGSAESLPETVLLAKNGFKVIFPDSGMTDAASIIGHVHNRTNDQARSIWWTGGSGIVPAQVATFIGMPSIEFMADLMSKDAASG